MYMHTPHARNVTVRRIRNEKERKNGEGNIIILNWVRVCMRVVCAYKYAPSAAACTCEHIKKIERSESYFS